MPGFPSRAAAWIDDRTGIRTAFRGVLLENIPASAGWPQVFGSVCLFLVLTQSLTGFLLAFNYGPTPGEAYTSLAYILKKVVGGHMVRGLHHWGSSFMIITVCLHMAQVFIYGAYKRPREVTWLIGVALLLLTLSFGLTGYLLPWDNRAYWGTMVTTRIMASVPLAGPLLTRLSGAANGIGVVTFSRFYALHTLLLPAATFLLIAIHLYLVRRHGVAPTSGKLGREQKFYPRQAFRDVLAVFFAFVILFAAAAFVDVPLERIADPTDATYIPRPEWYFLFLFQVLKFFPGRLEFIGTVLLPSAAVLALVALPFLNRLQARVLTGRLQAAGAALLVFSVWASLTTAAAWESPNPHRSSLVPPEGARWAQVAPEAIAGLGYFRASHCGFCHNLLAGDPKPGPNLAAAGVQHPKEWLVQHFKQPGATPGVVGTHLSLPQLNALSLFVENVKPDTISLLGEMSDPYIKGAQIFVVSACASCHKVNGVGGGLGPALNGLANRRSEQWVREHFVTPQKLSPGSVMPPYPFSRDDEKDLIGYLFSLPE